ncbi:hypothetical protein M5K25_008509 [Dendrobium thyrsiflorum]|uniref:Uncharacterized protein n=1 Tax=Dendrobium thyrsiflorum TaxID=117978 RepID=A0ABD0V875_DENTH
MQMDLQNTVFTVQLGRGANIQLANAVINTGSSGATIQFGSVDFPAVVARTTATPAYGTDSERLARRPHSTETSARRAHLSAPRATTAQDPRRRISVFERISQPEAPTTKRVVTGGKISVVTANTTTRPTGMSIPGKNNAEASSSGERLTRRQRRKMNAKLRAQQQLVPVHPSNRPVLEPEANVPIRNKFTDLKWSLPVLKTVKEKGLKKKGAQRPLVIEARRTPPRERLSFPPLGRNKRRQRASHGEHRGVTPEYRVQGSTAERSQRKGKQIWRPKPHRDDEEKGRKREIDLGVTSGVASRRSAPNIQDRRRWVQKKTHDDSRYDGRHLGESSRGSRCSPTPPKEEVNFDRSPRVEEILLPNQEPEIQWRRRSEIQMLEEEEEDIQDEDEEEMDEAINMEVVYMLRHTNINDEAYYDEGEDDENRQPPVRRVYRRQREAGSTADGGDRSQGEQEADEVEENHSDDGNITLANIRRQMRRQMRAKDREISQLNEKMTEMMAQMGAMMQMMQRTAVAGPMPDPPTDPPNLRMPQVSGVRGTPEGGHETHNVTRQPTPQNIASTSEPVTAAQFASATEKTTIADLALEKRKREESVTKYITRWRNLSMKCEQQLEEEHAVQLLMGNIDDKMQPFLCMATITTFQDLLDRVAKFEKLNLLKSESHFDRPKKTKASGARKGEADSAFFSRASMANQMIYNVDKGKQPMQYEEKPKQAYNPHPQPKLIFGGNDKPRNFQGGGERPKQNMGTSDRTFPSLKDKMNKEKESTRVVTSSSVPPDDERKDDKKLVQEEQWETAVSKKTTKMLRQLEGVPGVKWKSPTEPVLNLKGLSKVPASSSKQCPSQASSSKPKKVKSSKKKTKLKKPKEKKTTTQRVIDSLDEYYQTVRQPIKLADFMSGLKVGEAEKDGDADPLPTEVCLVISVVSSTLINEECAKEAAVESCMMVLPKDCSSEEDLYFPEEDESDPDIASQMKHVNLSGDSESTDESPDTTMADSEENVLSNESEPEEAAQAKASSSKAAKLPKQEREKKQVGRKKASPTLPKAAIIPKERKHIPHLGSDTEEDDVTPAKSRGIRQPSAKRRKEVEYANSDYDYESIFVNTVQCVFSRRIDSLSVSDSVLVVTRVPLQYFKEIIPREVHKVEELTTRYLPPLEKGIEPGNILYSVGIQEEENCDWCYKFVDSEELFPTRLPRFNTRGVQGMLRKQVNIPTSKRQLRTCLSLCEDMDESNIKLIANHKGLMDLQNTAFTVQLGRGANIQLANAVINTGSSGATIQFGSVDFPAVVARTTATPAYGTDSERLARRPHSTETSARRAHLSAPRATTAQDPRKNNAEASSSGERLTRRQRRKMNAKLRAQQQLVPVHPSNRPVLEPEANVPIRNKFTDLKWVKRNSSSGELKKSFWDRQPEVPVPQKKKEPESLSARVYRVLKTVKEKGLKKKGAQRPLVIEARRTPPRERLSFPPLGRNKRRQRASHGEHRGVTPEYRVQGSTAERSQRKGKQIWRPKPHRDDEEKGRKREIDLGVTSGVASRRSAPNIQDRRRWVQKKTHDDSRYDGRHLGESSRGSRCSPTPPKEEVNFDRSPRVEEILLPNQEPEIQWRRRSEIQMLEEEEEDIQDEDEEEMDEAINMEVVYMLRHTNINDEAYYDEGEDDENRQPPLGEYTDANVRLVPPPMEVIVLKENKKQMKLKRIILMMEISHSPTSEDR